MPSITRPSAPDTVRPPPVIGRAGPSRSDRIGTINQLLDRAWHHGWLPRPLLEPDALIALAERQTGLADAGPDTGWRARLDCLAEALHREAALSPLGRTMAHGQLLAALANRLRAHALWRKHREILERPIRAPIIVMGQMRSGTTRMQRLLACDPRLMFTRFFESWNPLPRSGRRGLIDDRIVRGWLGLRCARFLDPQFDVIHPTSVTQADEEIGLHSISIFGSAFEAQWRVPSFAARNEAEDTALIYREFKRLLQTIAWLRRDRGDRPWILKLPQMTQDLDAVLAAFPDARLVCLNRDATRVVASSASLAHGQMRLQSDDIDRDWIGREWLRKAAHRQHRAASVRAQADVPQVDVAFGAMDRDWRAEMRRVYAQMAMPLTDEVEARMAAYVARSRGHGGGGHRYDLSDFGLTEHQVRETLGHRC